MTLSERWNYQRGITNQLPVKAIRIVYAASGTLPAALVLRDERAIVEHKLYWAGAASEAEAQFLTAILNSETARIRTERYQSRGQFGARDFDKVIFNLPIPVFDASIKLHSDLAALSAHAEEVAAQVELPDAERFVAARQRVRRALIEEGVAADIEKAVEKLLGPEPAR